ncbi:3-oxoacyl-ACP synthase III family protein [Perlucidibaca piscinae]|uniref:3-oxoacyl-ACP synthase III family protein n=1 Tax=Perlucidibaca piscinae TaxID=392589 RepID=UPI0003B3FD72|nr:beta-ketoacyl-ACP synthase III [Perlucidibaca piscinae]
MSTPRARILGLGTFVPARTVTNHDLAEVMETSHDWIVERSGIEERHWVDAEEGNYTMGVKAARAALADAGVDASEIDCIVYATLSPDYFFPGCGVLVQRELGIGHVPAFDIRQQCSGFIYGLQMADVFIRAGQYRKILVIGGEVHSRGLDKTTRGRTVSVLFGDAAGAAVVGVSDDPEAGILITRVHSDGSDAECLAMQYPGMAAGRDSYVTHDDVESGRIFPNMEGQKVFKNAVKRMPEVIQEVLDAQGLTVADIDMLIPHQANLRINEMVAKQIGIDASRVHNNIQKYGNTTAATIPLCLSEARAEGKVKKGDLVCLVAFGSGFTWGSVLMRW